MYATRTPWPPRARKVRQLLIDPRRVLHHAMHARCGLGLCSRRMRSCRSAHAQARILAAGCGHGIMDPPPLRESHPNHCPLPQTLPGWQAGGLRWRPLCHCRAVRTPPPPSNAKGDAEALACMLAPSSCCKHGYAHVCYAAAARCCFARACCSASAAEGTSPLCARVHIHVCVRLSARSAPPPSLPRL